MNTLLKHKILTFISAITIASSAFGWNTPVQVSPASGSQSWNAIEFNWNPVINSLAYQFQLDTSSGFSSPIFFDTTIVYVDSTGFSDTHVLIDQLFFGTTYHWRVRAYNMNDTSVWSPVWTTTTRNAVTPVSPSAGDQTFVNVMLDWNSHIGVNYYDYQVDTSISFNSPALIMGIDIYFSELSSFYDTEQMIQNLYYGQNYFWRVRVRNLVDTSAWTTESFSTKELVEINSPAQGSSVFAGVLLDWNSFEGSFVYDYEIDTDNSFTSPNLISGSNLYQGSGSGNSDSEFFADDLYFGQQYYWRIRARNGVDTSAWNSSDFITDNTVYLNSPLNETFTGGAVLFDWLAHSGVDYYDYQIDLSPGFSSPNLISGQKTYINPMDGNTDTEIFINPLYFASTYYWRVRAHNAVDTCNWSESWKIHTHDTIQLISPVYGASTFTGLTFYWDDFDGCSSYQLQLDSSASFNSAFLNNYHIIGQSEKELFNLYFGTGYYWRVRGINALDTTAWSETRWLYTNNQVGLATPADSALSLNENGVYLDWWFHYGALAYELEIDTTNTFDSPNLVGQFFPYSTNNSTGPDTEYTTDTLYDNQIYFWRVRILNEVDTSKWEERWFSTGEDTLELPEAPMLQSPLFGELEVPVNTLLNWSDVPGAMGYYFQYEMTADFNNPFEDYVAISEAQILNLQFVTTYYWRARTFDGTFLSDWSITYHFKTEQETLSPPVLIYPDNGLSNFYVQNLIFDWEDVYHAQEYLIEYATDASFLFDLESDTTTNSEFEASGFTPNTSYFWRVKSLNDSLNNSDWSNTWTFTTTLALETPILTSPANLSSGLPFNHVILDWEDVQHADYYQVQHAHDLSFTNGMEIHSTPETYFILNNLDPLENYYWKVQAISDTLYNSEFSMTWSFSTSEDTAISVHEIEPDKISIFPNPSKGEVWINFPGKNQLSATIKVFNPNGQMVLSFSGINEQRHFIDLKNYASGLYYISIETGGTFFNSKILITD